MKLCLHCGTGNVDTHKFCQRCGKALPTPPPADPTVRWAGQVLPGATVKRTIAIDALFAGRSRLLIGRAPECDVCLPHPTVSRHHALLKRQDSGLVLRDLGSVNGVLVGGRPIAEPALIKEHERVAIGPFMFCLVGGVIHILDSSQSLRLEARRLEKVVGQGSRGMRKLLDDINLAVEPGEFISLLGPSGSGKSTLMDCLNGRRPATGGKVLANGEDFYLHFDSFRQSLGYVPQRDIVHTQLSVFRALYYTAQLRLPTDTGPSELNARIEEVLKLMELEPHRDTLIGNLSGGQIKRVSLGAELLARPCLLYIDEATSGLDAGTEARMMRLFRRLADEGRSVICITHNVDNVDLCNLILVLARGKLVYYGPPGEARSYFGVSRISDLYDSLAQKDAETWEKQFAASTLHKEFVADRLAAFKRPTRIVPQPPHPEFDADRLAPGAAELPGPATPGAREPSAPPLPAAAPEEPASRSGNAALVPDLKPPPLRSQRPPLWHQFRVLTIRYAELIWQDGHGLRLLLFQAPVVALFILLGFIDKPYQQKLLAPRVLTATEREALGQLVARLKQITERDQGGAAGAGATEANSPLELLEKARQQVLGGNLSASQRYTLDFLVLMVRKHYQENREHLDRLKLPQKLEYLTGVLDEVYRSNAPVMPAAMIISPRFTYMLLFLIVLIILWFGCNNASKEIVKEEAIYGRERAVNLGILPYLASKFLILSIITAFQTLVLMGVIYGTLGLFGRWLGHALPATEYYLPYLPQFGVLVVLSMTSVAAGLMLSSCVATPDRANALLPYVLIPQIILGGGILSIRSGPLYFIAVLLSPAYWAFRAVRVGFHDILPRDFPGYVDDWEGPWLPVLALLVQMVVLLLLTTWFLRQKDLRKV